jgi:putative ABC transport system substrate-binding protein
LCGGLAANTGVATPAVAGAAFASARSLLGRQEAMARLRRDMKRREFMTLLGGAAAAWPGASWAQQAAMPRVGFLNSGSPVVFADRLRAFHLGLKDTGFVEGENVAIVYRWADDQYDRLPELAAELVRLRVAVIVAKPRRPIFAVMHNATFLQ